MNIAIESGLALANPIYASEIVGLEEAIGRILAEDLLAKRLNNLACLQTKPFIDLPLADPVTQIGP